MDPAAIAIGSKWLHEADCILITAGAGMSAAAGLDYTDIHLFKSLFPEMAAVGFQCMYHFIGYHEPLCPDRTTAYSPDLKWGYLARQGLLARYRWRADSPIYMQTKDILAGKDYFIITSNADGLFGQSGFDLDHVFTTQGDYSKLQCLRKCRPDATWPAKPILEAIAASVGVTGRCDPALVPKCPFCAGPAFFNVRGGDWFIEDAHDKRKSYQDFLARAHGKKFAILEIGVGFNTPSVLRWPMEKLAMAHPNHTLLRINTEHPEFQHAVPPSNGIGLAARGEVAVAALHAAITSLRSV